VTSAKTTPSVLMTKSRLHDHLTGRPTEFPPPLARLSHKLIPQVRNTDATGSRTTMLVISKGQTTCQ